MTPKRVTQFAMGKDEKSEYMRNLHRLSHILEGNVGLMCTNLPSAQVCEHLKAVEDSFCCFVRLWRFWRILNLKILHELAKQRRRI